MDRFCTISRQTKETKIDVSLNLDGKGQFRIDTGIGFFNHMLEQLAFHGLLDLDVTCKGDLHIDPHHTSEDTALALGEALLKALGEKKGIRRYSHSYIAMDETLVRVVIDLSGRPEFVFQGDFNQPKIGEWDTQLIAHFFKSLAITAKATLHMCILYGQNDHHKCEALFKGLARALSEAVEIQPRRLEITSTKGIL